MKGRNVEIIERWYEEETARLRAKPETLALVDDPDVVAKGKEENGLLRFATTC